MMRLYVHSTLHKCLVCLQYFEALRHKIDDSYLLFQKYRYATLTVADVRQTNVHKVSYWNSTDGRKRLNVGLKSTIICNHDTNICS